MSTPSRSSSPPDAEPVAARQAKQRTALLSLAAAGALVALKLGVGAFAGSLALISAGIESSGDVVAAALTFFAVRLSGRAPDERHQYGHGRVEQLSALGEATILGAGGVFIVVEAIRRLTGPGGSEPTAGWYVFAVIGFAIAVDVSRTTISLRASHRWSSAAFRANAFHFAGDVVGSTAVLVGLILVRLGNPSADAVAALAVSAIILTAAVRLVFENGQALMDRAPAAAEDTVRAAIRRLRPVVELRRLRMREVAGRNFADVVITVRPDAGVGQGHAAADAVEHAIDRALPGSDVVVHVEPEALRAPVRERATAAALTVPGVREIHNVTVLDVEGHVELALHLKLPGELTLHQAHEVASHVEETILAEVPEVGRVQTHIEPLADTAGVLPADSAASGREAELRASIEALTDHRPLEVAVRATDQGLIALVTLAATPEQSLAEAHASASELEERLRLRHPDVADVVIHTEPIAPSGDT